MASAITHFVVGTALALPVARSARLRRVLPPWAIPVAAGLLAVIPDVDVSWFRHFPYNRLWAIADFRMRSSLWFFLLLPWQS